MEKYTVHTLSNCEYVCVKERDASLFQDIMEKLDHVVVTFGVFLRVRLVRRMEKWDDRKWGEDGKVGG